MSLVNTAVKKACDKTGIDVERLTQLHRPHYNAQLQSALGEVSKRFSLLFEKIARSNGA
jgi:hypothetical protein